MFGLPLTNEPCVENRLEARGWYVALEIAPVMEFQAKDTCNYGRLWCPILLALSIVIQNEKYSE